MLSTVLPTAILTVPAVTVKHAGQDAWVSIMIATLAGLLVVRLAVSLSLRFPGKTLVEYAPDILGNFLGKIVGFLYIWLYFLYIGSGAAREFSVFLVSAVMPETPALVFCMAGVAVVAYAARNGLEVLSRLNQLFIPVTGLLFIVFLLSAKDMKLTRVLPVFDAGLLPILKGAVTPAMWLGEIVTLMMIIPYLNEPKKAGRVAALSVLLCGFFLTVSVLEALFIFGPNLAGRYIFPVYNAVRVVSLANFLERLESVIVAAWVLGGFVKVGVFYYAAVLGSAQCLGLKDYRPLVLPVGVILVALAVLLHGENIVEVFSYIPQVEVPFLLLVFEAGLPLGLLTVALLRRKGGKS